MNCISAVFNVLTSLCFNVQNIFGPYAKYIFPLVFPMYRLYPLYTRDESGDPRCIHVRVCVCGWVGVEGGRWPLRRFICQLFYVSDNQLSTHYISNCEILLGKWRETYTTQL